MKFDGCSANSTSPASNSTDHASLFECVSDESDRMRILSVCTETFDDRVLEELAAFEAGSPPDHRVTEAVS